MKRTALISLVLLAGCAAPAPDLDDLSDDSRSGLCLICGETVLRYARGGGYVLTHVCTDTQRAVSVWLPTE